MLDGANSSTNGCTASASGRRRASTCPARKWARSLPLSEYSGSSMGNLPIGQGGARDADADGDAPTRRSPTAGSCARRTSCSAVNGHPAARAGGHRVISATTAAELRTDARGRARAGGHGQRGLDPRLSAGGQDRHGQQGRPGHRRILRKRICGLVHRLRSRVDPKLCARWSSTNRRPARSTAERSPRPPSARSCPSRCHTWASRRDSISCMRLDELIAASVTRARRRASAARSWRSPGSHTTAAACSRARCSSACADFAATDTTSPPRRSRAAPWRSWSSGRSGWVCPRSRSRRRARRWGPWRRGSTAIRPRSCRWSG